MSPCSEPAKLQELVPFPAEEIADAYLKFKYENAGLFKHLGVKRSYEDASYAGAIENWQYNRLASQQDNLLRTNVMFIAYKMKNVKNTVIHFTRFGLLSWDTKDHITSKKHERLMAVLLMNEILQFDSEKLPKVEKAFTGSENEHVWKLLVPDMTIVNTVEHVLKTRFDTLASSAEPIPSTSFATHDNAASTMYATVPAISTFAGVSETPATNGAGASCQSKPVPEVVDLSSPVPSPLPNNNYWTCESCESPNSETYALCLVCAIPRRGVVGTASISHEWACTMCSSKNVDNLQYCGGCYSPRYYSKGCETASQAVQTGREVEWDCAACTFKNPVNVPFCMICTAAR